MGGDGVRVVVFCGCVCAAGLGFFWSKFVADYMFYTESRAAICVEGRRMNQPITAAVVRADDTTQKKGVITMHCNTLVAVYPCLDEDVDPEEWKGDCGDLARVPMKEWWQLRRETDIRCTDSDWSLSYDKCGDREWSCSTGPCSAYEKTQRLCLSNHLRREPYACFYVPDSPEDGVREEHSGFPIGWLVGAVGFTALSCGCAIGFCLAIRDEEDCGKQCLGYSCCFLFIIGLTWLIQAVAKLLHGESQAEGPVEAKYTDLVVQTNTTESRSEVPHEAPPASANVWRVLGITFASVFGVMFFFVCVLGLLQLCKRRGHAVRHRAGIQRLSADDDKGRCASEGCRFYGSQALVKDGPLYCSVCYRKESAKVLSETGNVNAVDRICVAVLSEAESTKELSHKLAHKLGLRHSIRGVVNAKMYGRRWKRNAKIHPDESSDNAVA